MSNLVGNPEDRFSRVAAIILPAGHNTRAGDNDLMALMYIWFGK